MNKSVAEVGEKLGFDVAAGRAAMHRPVRGCYAGDLLSRVISRAVPDGAWITIMTNVNVAAVALLSGVSCVILAEDVLPDALLVEKCESEGIPLFRTPLDAYTLCYKIREIIAQT